MSKIYDGNVKLNVVQVCDKLRNEISESHAKLLAPKITNATAKNAKTIFAHAVLDTYKLMSGDTDEEAISKKLCKHLMEKYMKSTVNMDGEDSVYRMLCDRILEIGAVSA